MNDGDELKMSGLEREMQKNEWGKRETFEARGEDFDWMI